MCQGYVVWCIIRWLGNICKISLVDSVVDFFYHPIAIKLMESTFRRLLQIWKSTTMVVIMVVGAAVVVVVVSAAAVVVVVVVVGAAAVVVVVVIVVVVGAASVVVTVVVVTVATTGCVAMVVAVSVVVVVGVVVVVFSGTRPSLFIILIVEDHHVEAIVLAVGHCRNKLLYQSFVPTDLNVDVVLCFVSETNDEEKDDAESPQQTTTSRYIIRARARRNFFVSCGVFLSRATFFFSFDTFSFFVRRKTFAAAMR